MKQNRILSFAALLALLCVPGLSRAQQTLTVYDGMDSSDHVPAYLYYWDDYTKSQFIIPASDLTAMSGGTISALTFYTTSHNVPYTSTSECDVYLKEVTYTTLSAYVAKSTATVVYSGTVSIVSTSTGGTMTITFATPFTYNGGNLLIGIENTTDDHYKNIKFYGQTVTGASGAGSNSSSLDNVPFNQQNFIPKTTFTYTAAAPEWNFGDTMAYCGTNAECLNAVGVNASPFTWAVRYPAAMMAGRNYLDAVLLYCRENCAGDYTLTVYQGGDDAPQTQLYTHTYTLSDEAGWRDLPLYSTVQLDPTKNLWIVMHTEDIYCPASISATVNDGNAQLVYWNNQWQALPDVESSLDNAWMLYAVTSATVLAPSVDIEGPYVGAINQPLTFTITGTTGATFSWNFPGATPSTATGTTATATWSTAGTYNVICIASLNGLSSSDTQQVTILDDGLVVSGVNGSWSSVLPMSTYYNYNYSQQIYLQSELTSESYTIGGIKLYAKSNNTEKTRYIKVYLGHTTASAFSSNSDWQPIADQQLVFAGTHVVPVADSWVEITFDTPFTYNGSSNLVLTVLDTTGSNSSGGL